MELIFVGSAHLGLKRCQRVCAAAFTRCLTLNLPYWVSLALLLAPWLASAPPFPRCWVCRQGPWGTKSRCLPLIQDERRSRHANVPGQTACKLSPSPGRCCPASVLCFGASSPGPQDQGRAPGLLLCSTDTLGMKLRVRKELPLPCFLEYQPHFTSLQTEKGGLCFKRNISHNASIKWTWSHAGLLGVFDLQAVFFEPG